jgi:hypothetical protein
MTKQEVASDHLLAKCAASIGSGDDFPTIWQTILRGHPLVLGPPVQGVSGGRLRLEVFLITGQRLVFDSTSKEFSLS